MLMIREALASIRSRADEGATAVEYAIMVALIAAVIIGAVTLLGTNAKTTLCDTANTIGTGAAGTC